MSSAKQLAIKSENNLVNLNMGFMIAATLQDAIQISEIIANSGVCPTQYKGKAGDVLVAMQMGAELGLKPMQALQNIAVINGRPSVWGDAMLAICRQSSQFEYIKETYNKADNSYTCVIKRRDEPEFVDNFSEADARKAGLLEKAGPWKQYPKRMLQMRARGFCLRNAFPDLLRGIITQEEAHDYPEERVINASIQEKRTQNNQTEENTFPVERLISAEELDILKFKIEQAGADEINMCKLLKIDCLESMPAEKWARVVIKLDKQITDKAKAASVEINNVVNKVDPVVEDFFGGVDAETGEVV